MLLRTRKLTATSPPLAAAPSPSISTSGRQAAHIMTTPVTTRIRMNAAFCRPHATRDSGALRRHGELCPCAEARHEAKPRVAIGLQLHAGAEHGHDERDGLGVEAAADGVELVA